MARPISLNSPWNRTSPPPRKHSRMSSTPPRSTTAASPRNRSTAPKSSSSRTSRRPADGCCRDLEEFVRARRRPDHLRGAVGGHAGPTSRNSGSNGKGLLPCAIKGAGHVDEGQAPARILSQRHTHPATVYFNDARGLRLQDAAFQHWLKFDRIEGEARVLLSLDRGDALMVEKTVRQRPRHRRGQHRQRALEQSSAATGVRAADAASRHLPRRAERRAAIPTLRHAAPGQPRQGPVARSLRADRSAEPDPRPHAGDRQGRQCVRSTIPCTQQPGVYELRAKSAPKNEPPRRFAFHLNPAESNLAPLPPAKARETAARLGAAYAESYDDYERLDRSRRHGSEIWQAAARSCCSGCYSSRSGCSRRISRA